jgi:hypothetical protein
MASEARRRFNALGGTTTQCTFRNGDTALSLSGVEVDVVRSVKLFVNTGWDAMRGGMGALDAGEPYKTAISDWREPPGRLLQGVHATQRSQR